MTDFTSDLNPWDRVIIDGDASIVAIVTAFQFRPSSSGGFNHMIEVSYINNGASCIVIIERKRLKVVSMSRDNTS